MLSSKDIVVFTAHAQHLSHSSMDTMQAHMSRLPAPISDYVTDTKSVLDQSLRILQAITDVSADAGWLDTALTAMLLVQSLMQVSYSSHVGTPLVMQGLLLNPNFTA